MKKSAIRLCAILLCLCVCTVSAAAAEYLIPVGAVIGLELSDGSVTVAAFDDSLGTGAREAGLRPGDKILAIDGKAEQLIKHDEMRRVMRVMELAFESDEKKAPVEFTI